MIIFFLIFSYTFSFSNFAEYQKINEINLTNLLNLHNFFYSACFCVLKCWLLDKIWRMSELPSLLLMWHFLAKIHNFRGVGIGWTDWAIAHRVLGKSNVWKIPCLTFLGFLFIVCPTRFQVLPTSLNIWNVMFTGDTILFSRSLLKCILM